VRSNRANSELSNSDTPPFEQTTTATAQWRLDVIESHATVTFEDDAVVETANDLVIKCTAAARGGADFPAIWNSVLRAHPLVVGPPIQTFADDDVSQLEIRLINGQRLVYDSTSNQYSILWAPRRRPF
jgi:hypothetical protein